MEPTLLGKEGSGNDRLPRGARGGAQSDGCQIERDGVPLPLVDKPDSEPVDSESEHWARRMYGAIENARPVGAHSPDRVRNATQVSTFGVLKESSASRCLRAPNGTSTGELPWARRSCCQSMSAFSIRFSAKCR